MYELASLIVLQKERQCFRDRGLLGGGALVTPPIRMPRQSRQRTRLVGLLVAGRVRVHVEAQRPRLYRTVGGDAASLVTAVPYLHRASCGAAPERVGCVGDTNDEQYTKNARRGGLRHECGSTWRLIAREQCRKPFGRSEWYDYGPITRYVVVRCAFTCRHVQTRARGHGRGRGQIPSRWPPPSRHSGGPPGVTEGRFRGGGGEAFIAFRWFPRFADAFCGASRTVSTCYPVTFPGLPNAGYTWGSEKCRRRPLAFRGRRHPVS